MADEFQDLIDATSRAGHAQHALGHQVSMDHFQQLDRAIEQLAELAMVQSGAAIARRVAENPTMRTPR